ncbi:MAG: hypothetical protein JWM80_1662 [Cyanobacteria bacterium RYN_339]|nr:hypothetical protein [Cyanobacteria bacterium RYN_339]
MPNVSNGTGSLEGSRQAAERARQAQDAAIERKRLTEIQEQRTAKPVVQISKETFVQEGKVAGTDPKAREALFDRFDVDGTAGLSEEELGHLFGASAAPEVSPKVQKELDNALKDDKDTQQDLLDAAKHAQTPEDVDAILAVAESKCMDQQAVLQAIVKAQPEGWDNPNTALLNRVADHYDRLGKPELAAAVRAVGDPAVSNEVRLHVIQALKDDKDTAKDIEKALEAATNAVDLAAAGAGGAATIGVETTAELTAVKEVTAAQTAYDTALKQCEDANITLQLALADMQGLSRDEQSKFIAAFKADHPEYQGFEAAQSHLAETVTRNQDAIATALQSGEEAGNVDTAVLEKAVSIAAEAPAGMDAARFIATAVLDHAEDVPEERLKLITDDVLPVLLNSLVLRSLAENGNDPVAALAEFEDSKLGEAIDQAKETCEGLEPFAKGVKSLKDALSSKDSGAAVEAVEKAAGLGTKLGSALAAIGLVTGALGLANADGFADQAEAAVKLGSTSAEVFALAGKGFARLGEHLPLELLEHAGPVLNAVASAILGVKDLLNGDLVAATEDGVNVALGVIAATSEIPGVDVAAAIFAGGFLVLGAIRESQVYDHRVDEIRAVMDRVGMEKGLVTFLTDSDPGAFDAAVTNLGLTSDQVKALVKDGSPWTTALDDFALPEFKQNVLPLFKNKDTFAVLNGLGKGLGSKGSEWMGEVLQYLAFPTVDDLTGRTKSIEDRLLEAESAVNNNLNNQFDDNRDDVNLARQQLHAAFGLG